jgi:hypothetical protein
MDMSSSNSLPVDPAWLTEQEEIVKQAKAAKDMIRVVIESPYAGNYDMNEAYAELAMHDCLVNYNESPYASHLLYTRRFVLRDSVPSDRKLGIKAGFYWRDVAQKSVFYQDLGMTDGMKEGIGDCIIKNNPYETRRLPEDLWDTFVDFCLEKRYVYTKEK